MVNCILKNYDAFVANFGNARIERRRNSWAVYYPEDSDEYIQLCPDLSYLDGWLYGCVQGVLVVQHRSRQKN